MLQQLDYLAYIDIYNERIKMFHVKDAEFRPTGKQGVYSGYASWKNRAGRFRSLGDGQVDFNGIFSKFAAYDFEGWAVLEWECALKHPEDGAREGAPFIKKHIIRVTEKAFDDFAAGGDISVALKTLGLEVMRPLRWGMIGGGEGAFIGAVHRMAARLDGRYQLLAGVFSSDAEKTKRSAVALGVDPGACLPDCRGHDRGRGQATRRRRSGVGGHAESHALRAVGGVARSRPRRDLRQAADHQSRATPRNS